MTLALRNFANAASEKITSYHNWVKNVEKARFGEGYTIVSDKIDYYIVECIAKPILSAVGDQIRKHPYHYGIGTLLLLAFLAHPNRKTGTNTKNSPSIPSAKTALFSKYATPLRRAHSAENLNTPTK